MTLLGYPRRGWWRTGNILAAGLIRVGGIGAGSEVGFSPMGVVGEGLVRPSQAAPAEPRESSRPKRFASKLLYYWQRAANIGSGCDALALIPLFPLCKRAYCSAVRAATKAFGVGQETLRMLLFSGDPGL